MKCEVGMVRGGGEVLHRVSSLLSSPHCEAMGMVGWHTCVQVLVVVDSCAMSRVGVDSRDNVHLRQPGPNSPGLHASPSQGHPICTPRPCPLTISSALFFPLTSPPPTSRLPCPWPPAPISPFTMVWCTWCAQIELSRGSMPLPDEDLVRLVRQVKAVGGQARGGESGAGDDGVTEDVRAGGWHTDVPAAFVSRLSLEHAMFDASDPKARTHTAGHGQQAGRRCVLCC